MRDAKTVIETVLTARRHDIEKYALTVEGIKKGDITKDRAYQRNYNGFYRVRRGADWQKVYYEIFEREKNNEPHFDKILTEIYDRTGNTEMSFTSKMVHSIDTNKPIWDQYVLANLGLELKVYNPVKRINKAIELYSEIEEWYRDFIDTDEAHQWIQEFDKALNEYSWISDTKKIDFILWGMR